MNDELYGVFFRDQGVTEYLVAVGEHPDDAGEHAGQLDEQAFDAAMEKHADEPDEFPEPEWEDFEGMHYVEPISRELAEDASFELERGFAVRVE